MLACSFRFHEMWSDVVVFCVFSCISAFRPAISTNRPGNRPSSNGNTVCIKHLYIRDATVPDHASFHQLGGKSISRSLSRTSSGLGYAAAAMRCMICI